MRGVVEWDENCGKNFHWRAGPFHGQMMANFNIVVLLHPKLLLLLCCCNAIFHNITSATFPVLRQPETALLDGQVPFVEQLVESCGKCHFRLPEGEGRLTAELFSFQDQGQSRRFVFVCPKSGRMRMLDDQQTRQLVEADSMLAMLLEEERKNSPMKRFKTKTVVATATSTTPETSPEPTMVTRKAAAALWHMQRTMVPGEKGPIYQRREKRVQRQQMTNNNNNNYYPMPKACQLEKLRRIAKAPLYRSKYATARLAHMGFVPVQPEQWAQAWNGDGQQQQLHKWWWYFALRLDASNCLLARLPTGAARINLDLGVRLVDSARPLFACPLLASTSSASNGSTAIARNFGCSEPHIFLLPNDSQNQVPMELGFSYQWSRDEELPPAANLLLVNPFELRNASVKKAVRVLLGQQFGGVENFMEFAPYCDYADSFVPIEPIGGGDQRQKKKKELVPKMQSPPISSETKSPSAIDLPKTELKASGLAAVENLRQAFFSLKSGLKSVKDAIGRFRKTVEAF